MILASRWGAKFYFNKEADCYEHDNTSILSIQAANDAKDTMVEITGAVNFEDYNCMCENEPAKVRKILRSL